MKTNRKFTECFIFSLLGILFLLPTSDVWAGDLPPLTLIDFSQPYNVDLISKRFVNMSITGTGVLRLETEVSQFCPAIVLPAPDGNWDLSGYGEVSVNVKNIGEGNGELCCRLDDYSDVREENGRPSGCISLEPATSGVIKISLKHAADLNRTIKFIGMKKTPLTVYDFDPANERKIIFYNPFTPVTDQKQIFEVSSIQATGSMEPFIPSTADDFFPMIDKFGQYIHNEWPGKIHSVDELQAKITEEEQDILAHPGPNDRNKYGGWAKGPELTATGFFRVEKYQDKWWLIDPEGRLFWSNGLNVISNGGDTPITARENYFAELPADSSPYAEFYGTRSGSASRDYKLYDEIKTYNFMTANLVRKYGTDWQQLFLEKTAHRLHNWGINTLGNWTSAEQFNRRGFPYVKSIAHTAKVITGNDGDSIKIIDVFDPSFRSGMAESLAQEVGKSANDPWCIGYFVDNEPDVGDEMTLANAVIASPPEQKAKQVFVNDLRTKYDTIENFNTVWGTSFASWDAFLNSTSGQIPPGADKQKVEEDCLDYYKKSTEIYFQTISEEIKKVAPNQLYMGCRFADYNDAIVLSAAKYCDVVSFNLYKYTVEQDPIPLGVDVPVIIGEFHFGSLDSGMFWQGIKKAIDQKHRGELFEQYMLSALKNPKFIGAHWFQYWDQPTTGRFDGANCQIGFIDSCDTPYFEFIESVRHVSKGMYNYRIFGTYSYSVAPVKNLKLF